MKRTAATMVMLAGLGGCASPETAPESAPFNQAYTAKPVDGLIGPAGEPIVAAGQMPTGKESKVTRADFKAPAGAPSGVKQTAGFARLGGGVRTPGLAGGGCPDGSCGPAGTIGAYGPQAHGFGQMMGHGGILPVPAMGPPGAVAAVGAIGGGMGGMYPPMYANQRTSIRFTSPAGMKVSWRGPDGRFVEPEPLQARGRYNFPQGSIYGLKLYGIPNRPATEFYYPTLEVYPTTPKTVTFLSHCTVPVSFTDEDFDQAKNGNLVVKVIYLPDAQFQDLAAVAGAEEVVSTRLEPGVNPVDEANRRGTILAVVRLGNIDLEDKSTPGMEAPPGIMPGAPRTMPAPTSPPKPMTGGTTPGTAAAPRTPAPLPPAVKSPSTGGISTPSTPIRLPQ